MKNTTDKFTNVNYITVGLGKKILYTFQADEINGKSKFEFQKLLGEKFGNHKFHISQNDKGEFKNKSYFLPGIITGDNLKNDVKNDIVENENFTGLFKLIDERNQNHLRELEKSFNDKIIIMKESFENEKKYYNNEITKLKETILEYEKEIDKINNNNGGGDIMSAISQIGQLRNLFNPGGPANVLQDRTAQTGENPKLKIFIDLFLKVDFDKVSNDDVNKYYNILNNFIQQLPLKQ